MTSIPRPILPPWLPTQVILTLGNNTEGFIAGDPAVSVAHDASAEEMREALTSLIEASMDGFVGEIFVSRQTNGAEGMGAYR